MDFCPRRPSSRGAFCSRSTPNTTWEERARNQRQLGAETPHPSILLGDSIAQNAFKFSVATDYFCNWLNFGIGGDKAENVLWRASKLPRHARNIVIIAGTNNVVGNDSPELIADTVLSIALKAHHNVSGTVTVMGLLPRSDVFVSGKIIEVNVLLARKCTSRCIAFVPVDGAFYSSTGITLNSNLFLRDRIHLNERGYRVYAKSVVAALPSPRSAAPFPPPPVPPAVEDHSPVSSAAQCPAADKEPSAPPAVEDRSPVSSAALSPASFDEFHHLGLTSISTPFFSGWCMPRLPSSSLFHLHFAVCFLLSSLWGYLLVFEKDCFFNLIIALLCGICICLILLDYLYPKIIFVRHLVYYVSHCFFKLFGYKSNGKIYKGKTCNKPKHVLRCIVLLTIFVLAKHVDNMETDSVFSKLRLCQNKDFFTIESIKLCENLSMKIISFNIRMTKTRLLIFKSNQAFILSLLLLLCGDVEVNPGPITNNDVVIWLEKDDVKGLNQIHYWHKFLEDFHLETSLCDDKYFRVKINRMKDKLDKLRRKSAAKNKSKFLEETFFATPNESNPEPPDINAQVSLENAKLKQDNLNMKRKIDEYQQQEDQLFTESQALRELLNQLGESNHVAENELNNIKQKYNASINRHEKEAEESAEKVKRLENKKEQMRNQKKNVTRKCNRKCDRLRLELEKGKQKSVEQKQRENAMSDDINKLQQNLDKNESRFEEMHYQKKRLANKLSKLQKKLEINRGFDLHKLEKECHNLQSQVSTLNDENQELHELTTILNDKELVTFANGRFSDEMRQTIMTLVSKNVSLKQVNEVIKTVLKGLTHYDTENMRLPSIATRSKFLNEALLLGKIQVAEAMLKDGVDGDVGNCIHGDGTSKYSKHYQNFQITTKSGDTLSFGLSEVATADASAVLKDLLKTIDSICDVLEEGDGLEDKVTNFEKLVCSIKNTMSDLGPVNPLFNEKFKAVREEMLPRIIANWDSLDEKYKSQLLDMGNFFCKLHLLSNFATETDKHLKTFEKAMTRDDAENQYAFNTKESSPVQLIRIACKAFHPRGSDECGVASPFTSALSEINETNHFASFIGNRFNILYHNAAALYFHKEHIDTFLKNWPNPNRLLKSVNELIQNPFNLACVRALAIVDKILTGPLWRLIEDKSILEMTPFLKALKTKLDVIAQNSKSIFEDDFFMFDPKTFGEDGQINKESAIYKKLFENHTPEVNEMTYQALEAILSAIQLILERQAKDQLDGGKYARASDSLKKSAENVPAHNKASESDFGILQHLINNKPRANIETYEVLTLFPRNKTDDWLNSKSPDMRAKLMCHARKGSAKLKQYYDDQRVQLAQNKLEVLHEKQEEKRLDEEKKTVNRAEAVNRLITNNISAWITIDQANTKINEIEGDAAKKEAVLAQLNFYKHVMLAGRKGVSYDFFTKSKKGVQLTFDELFQKLLNAITCAITPDADADYIKKSTLRPVDEREQLVNEHKANMRKRVLDFRFSNFLDSKNQANLPKYKNNPQLLVNCRIRHKLKATKESDETWCLGVVECVEKVDEVDPMKTSFGVRYMEDDEKLYYFPLLKDMQTKECFVL